MWHDYGYIEDDRGKTYDLKLIRRFASYGKPYIALLALTCVLILAATAADLVLPYITKIAIDRYILPYSHQVKMTADTAPDLKDIVEKRMDLMRPTGRANHFFLSTENARRMDPGNLDRLTQAGIISRDTYYLVDSKSEKGMQAAEDHPELFFFFPDVAAISSQDLKELGQTDPKGLSRIRADNMAGLLHLALVLCLVIVGGYLFEFTQVMLLEYTGQRLTHDLRQDLIAHVLNQSVAFHDKSTTGRLVARITNDIQNLGEMIKSMAVTVFKDIFVLSGIVVLLLYINYRLALVTFTLIPPIIIITLIFRRKARAVFRALRGKVAQINSVIGETVAGMRIVQAFRREDENRKLFGKLNYNNYLAGIRQVRVFAVFMPLIDLLAALALGLIIWYGGLNVIKGAMTLGAVVAYIGYVRKFFQPIREMAEKFNVLQSAMASLERIFLLMDHQESLPVPLDPQTPTLGGGAIRFDHVHFEYQPGVPVLRDVSFDLEPGSTLAIVGATGAGKTSIINLLLRFYDVTSGRVLVDGQDVRDLDLDGHRSRIGLVMQDVFLFAGSVKENIAFSRDELAVDKIENAARAANAAVFIDHLPNGYDQVLGEGGLSLSFGQRQLLSFSRALALDPQILVLDEATAFIDSETEKLIEEALERLTVGRTSILIAHRLSTIKRADRILVLDHGGVVEMGTHDELMTRGGHYRQLYEIQFKRSDEV